MKKFFLSLAVILGIGAALLPVISGKNQTPVQIVVSQQDQGGQVPRMPGVSPISGFVFIDTIYLQFSENLGDVTVSLSETSTGQLLSTVVDSSNGYAIIPFSGDTGCYTLTFILENGASYIGRFEIL